MKEWAGDYALSEKAPVEDVLTHLDLLDKDNPNHAAILLFGTKPQRFLITSEVKCMHFHGTRKAKPIPSYQIYKGTVFDMVDQSVDFVMSKLTRFVGTRKHSTQAPVKYDIPKDVVAEGIVNAVAHRDYTSNASVEIMLFSDRLEIWNPGTLPPSLTIESLSKSHSSQPANPLIAEPLFLTKYIDKAGTGTIDIFNNCREAGLKPPKFRSENGFFILTVWRKQESGKPKLQTGSAPSRHQVGTKSAPSWHQVGTKSAPSRHQVEILHKCLHDSGIADLMVIMGRSDRTKFRNQVLNPLIEAGLLGMTYPDKPRSSKQKYRLTKKGKQHIKKHSEKD